MHRRSFMRTLGTAALSLTAATLLVASPAAAQLKVSEAAPDFSLQAAENGKVSTFALKSALKKGPVVVYFYPKAFTSGCSIEAKMFADNISAFKAAGASVIGVSTDDIKTLQDFSTKDCGGKFPVAADTKGTVAGNYKVKNAMGMASRVTFVVTPNGKVAFVQGGSDPKTHVNASLAFVQSLKAKR